MSSQHNSLSVWALQKSEQLLNLSNLELCLLWGARSIALRRVEPHEFLYPQCFSSITNNYHWQLLRLLGVLLCEPLLETAPQDVYELVKPTHRHCSTLWWDLLMTLLKSHIWNMLRKSTPSTGCHRCTSKKSTQGSTQVSRTSLTWRTARGHGDS